MTQVKPTVVVASTSTVVPTTSTTRPVSEVCTQQQQQQTPSKPSTLTITTASTSASTSSVSAHSPPTNNKMSPPPSIHAQFTVHGQFLGAGDLCRGPAPNVTVNPLYHPPEQPGPPRSHPSSNSAADQQIRVLTPSEIMRTLPSLCQENYDAQPTPPPPVRECSVVSLSLGGNDFFIIIFLFNLILCWLAIKLYLLF